MWAARSAWGRSCTTLRRPCITLLATEATIGPVGLRVRPASTADVGADHRLSATRRWLDTVVIGERLCPFAAPVRTTPGRLRIRASVAKDVAGVVAEVAAEARLLAQGLGLECPTLEAGKGDEATAAKWPPPKAGTMVSETNCTSDQLGLPETTLLVFSEVSQPFVADWPDLVRLSWRLQAEAVEGQGFARDLQLVLFHPQAVHSTYAEGPPDAADYSIRAPHPMVHLLREADVMRGVAADPKAAAQIPTRNKARLRAQGLDVCASRLASCRGE
mmetsp:Transcript_74388/g.206529  ORF Transcript_74388/g.206529 Transcript_74388/m.206529 type:complete len:274 (-) Transcript_74388:71-892(-)